MLMWINEISMYHAGFAAPTEKREQSDIVSLVDTQLSQLEIDEDDFMVLPLADFSL